MRTRYMTAVLAASLLLGVTACGQGAIDDGVAIETDARVLSEAVERTTDTSTGRFESSITVTTTAEDGTGDEPMSATMSGSYDLAADRSQMTMAFETGLAGDDVAGGEISTIQDGTTIYMKLSVDAGVAGASGFPGFGTDQWIKSDALGEGGDIGSLLPGVGSGAASFDPSGYLDLLRGASADGLEVVGNESVRGVDTTHYRGTLTLGRAIDNALSPEDRAGLEEFMARAPDAEVLDAEMAFDVYVDAEGLVRRVSADLASLAGAFGEPGSIVMTTDYFGFGEPVDIGVPSPDEVLDMESMMREMMEGIGGEWPEGLPEGFPDELPEGWLGEGD